MSSWSSQRRPRLRWRVTWGRDLVDDLPVEQVEQLLGAPTGRATFPAVLTKGNTKDFYSYVTLDKATRKIQNKSLVVLYGPDGRLPGPSS